MINNCPIVSVKTHEKILEQMKKCICKIYKGNGTGFFCEIPYKNNKKLKVLITNFHVIDEEYIKDNKVIKYSLGDSDNPKDMLLDSDRKIYLDEEYDTTIIEIKENDNIENYLELDENLFENNSELFYENNIIYCIQYPELNNSSSSVSYGIIKKFDNYNLNHLCSVKNDSLGSPLLNLLNNKVIGLHKTSSKEFNIGTFLKYPINEFIRSFEIKIALKIESQEIFLYKYDLNFRIRLYIS